MDIKDIPGSEFTIKADLVLLAMGFLHPQKKGLIELLGVELDGRGNVKTNSGMMTSLDKYFSCGDMSHGQSLVVRAIASGRECARNIDSNLMGDSKLPRVRGFARI
jgi:glutamate synthase (NADPH/NADH) small chain